MNTYFLPHYTVQRSTHPIVMKKVLFLAVLLICLACFNFAAAQSRTATPDPALIAAGITSSELQRHLMVLASEEMQGRETGTEGQLKAAQYIADVFSSWQLPKVGDDNSYFQHILFRTETWKRVELTIDGKKYRHLWEYYATPLLNEGKSSEWSFNEVLFLGYGIDDPNYSDYKGVDVKGKALLIYDGEPVNASGISYITGSSERSNWTTEHKLAVAKSQGAAFVLVIDSGFKENVAEVRKALANTRLQPAQSKSNAQAMAPNCHLSSETAKALLGTQLKKVIRQRDKILKKGRPSGTNIPVNIEVVLDKETRELSGHNVLGYVQGSDPQLQHELVVVSAHFDHLGMRGDAIYYGADDNASGTSAVLEIAQAFSDARQAGMGPRRSVLFLLVSGEEKGLLGSQYYVEHPVFPLENTIANVNVDMVGRVDAKHADNPHYIYVIGADRLSTELHRINENANATFTRLELDYTYNAKNDPNRYYYRSDHYNFAERGIPAVFYFSGTHQDYHRTTDTVDKINFDKMVKIAQLVFHTTWDLANRDQRIQVDVKK
jgi:hypothetical protein